jgi:hypothetical protein
MNQMINSVMHLGYCVMGVADNSPRVVLHIIGEVMEIDLNMVQPVLRLTIGSSRLATGRPFRSVNMSPDILQCRPSVIIGIPAIIVDVIG